MRTSHRSFASVSIGCSKQHVRAAFQREDVADKLLPTALPQNLCKYGVLVQPSSLLYLAKIPNVVLTLSIWIYIFAAYGIEMMRGHLPAPLHLSLHWTNAVASFLGPWYGMWYLQTDPGGGKLLFCHSPIQLKGPKARI